MISINSTCISNIISFNKNKDNYKITFKKDNIQSSISFVASLLKIIKGKLVTKKQINNYDLIKIIYNYSY